MGSPFASRGREAGFAAGNPNPSTSVESVKDRQSFHGCARHEPQGHWLADVPPQHRPAYILHDRSRSGRGGRHTIDISGAEPGVGPRVEIYKVVQGSDCLLNHNHQPQRRPHIKMNGRLVETAEISDVHAQTIPCRARPDFYPLQRTLRNLSVTAQLRRLNLANASLGRIIQSSVSHASKKFWRLDRQAPQVAGDSLEACQSDAGCELPVAGKGMSLC
ncbi:hypothetical protein LIA77_03729 [Sarocladium implicatum]|nr:hypothetical protein LIA77_03729 [Sarocladium implicatum]